jgi:hypothetical protein
VNPRIVILLSYCRPELTKEAIERLLKWETLDTLFVSIDGLRFGCGESERRWQAETIKQVANLASFDPRIRPIFWSTNTGITGHVSRILEVVLEQTESVIILEEDQKITQDGLEFLYSNVNERGTPRVASAYTRQNHSKLSNGLTYRETIFPEQWGISLNRLIAEKFLQLVKTKRIDEDLLRSNFREIHPKNALKVELLTKLWSDTFRIAVNSPNHTDAIIQYASMSLQAHYRVPIITQVQDLGHLDARGLTKRSETIEKLPHNFKALNFEKEKVCLTCEIENSQMEGLGIKSILLRKFSNLINPR